MHRFSVTLMAATLSELYASAAEFASSGNLNAHAVTGSPVNAGVPPQPTPNGDGEDDDNATPAANAPAVDGAGIPWDERIHSGSKGMNADRTWKRRRNTPDATFDSVMAELRQRIAAAPVQAAPPPLPMPSPMQQGVNAAHGIPAPAPMAAPQPMNPPAPIAPELAPPGMGFTAPAPQPAGMDFNVFMPKFAAAMHSGKFTQADLPGFYQAWQISDLGQLQADPVRLLQFHDWLVAGGRL